MTAEAHIAGLRSLLGGPDEIRMNEPAHPQPATPFNNSTLADQAATRRLAATHRWFEVPKGHQYLGGLIAQQRHDAILDFRNSVQFAAPSTQDRLAEITAELEADNPGREARRLAEQTLADYIEEAVLPAASLDLLGELQKRVEAMRLCRTCGTVGIRPSGGHVVAWDCKCNNVRLCPDDAREETRRLAHRYLPAIMDWANQKPTRRVFYAVFTFGNFEPGRLAHGKEFLMKRFRLWMDEKRACTDADRRRYGYTDRKRKVKRWRPGPDPEAGQPYVGPGLHGALTVQEDPLSADGSWNVHLNALLMIEGRFDFKTVRETWGANVELRELDPEPHALAGAVNELIKYSARHVASKAEEKAESGATDAPAMTQWTAAQWLEWYRAQKARRRTRSYGCLFRVPEPDSEGMDGVEWVGTIKFTDAGCYRVDLIPGNNFSRSAPARARADYLPPSVGPPIFH